MGAAFPTWGVLWAIAGELKPNWMPDLAPPLAAKELVPLAAMVTELFLEWSAPEPLVELPRATAGTAGVATGLPFTGDRRELLAFCAAEAEAEPTTMGA